MPAQVSIDVAPGELVAFLDPNGAGKSTTLRMLTRLLPPTSGRAWVAGASVTDDPALSGPLLRHEHSRRGHVLVGLPILGVFCIGAFSNVLTWIVDAERALFAGRWSDPAIGWAVLAAVLTCVAGLAVGVRQVQRSTV